MFAVPNDWDAMKGAYDESVDDLEKLLEYACGFEVDVVTRDGGDYYEMALATAMTGGMLPNSSWDRLNLACVLGVAIARLVAHENGGDRG